MRFLAKLSLIVVTAVFMSGCTTLKPVTREALLTPLPVYGKDKAPRISVAGLPNTQVALELLRDNEKICTVVGQLVGYVHRMYHTNRRKLLIADGVCYGAAIQATGTHYYSLRGYIFTSKGKRINVNRSIRATTYNLAEPVILINEKNEVSLYLDES